MKDLESLAGAIKSLLESDLGASLDTEEARWTDDPLTLDDPNTWELGLDLSRYFLDYEQGEFPVVSVLAITSEGLKGAGQYADQWDYQSVRAVVFIDFCVQVATAADCAKIGWRYGQALIATMQAQRKVGNWQQMFFYPDLSFTPVSRQLDEDASPDDFYHTQVGRLELVMER